MLLLATRLKRISPQNGHFLALQIPLLLTHGVKIQGLGWVRVCTVTGIPTMEDSTTRDEMGRTGGAMSNDDDIRSQSFQISDGVLSRHFPLFERRGLCCKCDDIRVQTLGGQLKTHSVMCMEWLH